jgi:hypothetical protein
MAQKKIHDREKHGTEVFSVMFAITAISILFFVVTMVLK